MVTDPYGTDIASLVPMDLDPEPIAGVGAAHPDNEVGENVEAPEADLSGDPIPDGDDLDGDLDEEADRALTEEGGD
jgi:hypothetical protein